MAETLRELVVALSLDSSNFSRNMRTINAQIKEAESTFRLAGAGVENFEKTIAGTEAKLSMLGNKLTQQHRAVEQYSRALVAANEKLKENYNRHQDYSVQYIRKAIEGDRQISFQYLRYTPQKKQVPKHPAGGSGTDYVVSPYATVWNNDRYYLVGWSHRREKVTTFRIDRMKVPEVLDRKRLPPPEGFDVRDYTDKVFWMFDGPKETVTLRCRTGILDQVIDRFGEDVDLKVLDSSMFDVKVPVSVSSTFFAWVFQFTGEMRILGPGHVREKYAEMLEDAIDVTLG